MPNRSRRIPQYRHYKPKDLGVVRIDGKDEYLGKYTPPPKDGIGATVALPNGLLAIKAQTILTPFCFASDETGKSRPVD